MSDKLDKFDKEALEIGLQWQMSTSDAYARMFIALGLNVKARHEAGQRINRAGQHIGFLWSSHGIVLTDQVVYRAHTFVSRHPSPVLQQRCIDLKMPQRILWRATRWTEEMMDEAFGIVDSRGINDGWRIVTEKYSMKQTTRRVKQNYDHRGQSVYAGIDDNVDMKKLKKDGEIDFEAAHDIIAHVHSTIGDIEFEKAIATSYRRLGRQRIA